jgi:L-lactate dehydrogenase (cytochrome)
LNLRSLLSFATHPRWALNYFTHERFELSQLKDYVKEGTNVAVSVAEYFNTMLDQSMDWQAAEDIANYWGRPFVLKGVMSANDAKHAADIGAKACSGGRAYLYALALAPPQPPAGPHARSN